MDQPQTQQDMTGQPGRHRDATEWPVESLEELQRSATRVGEHVLQVCNYSPPKPDLKCDERKAIIKRPPQAVRGNIDAVHPSRQ